MWGRFNNNSGGFSANKIMTQEEYKIISEALLDLKVNIFKSIDKHTHEMKLILDEHYQDKLDLDQEKDLQDLKNHELEK
jgi:hypothetical protein